MTIVLTQPKERKGKPNRIEEKVKSIEKRLGKSLKK
jgi:hypothetical protein